MAIKIMAVKNKSNNHSEGNSVVGSNPTFFVATRKDGTAFYLEGKSAEEFLPKLKNCKYSWVNIQVEDIVKDGPKTAQAIGFTPILVSNLLKEKVSGYDDLVSELGLLVPAMRIRGLEVEINQLIILIKKDMIATIHGPNVTRLMRFSRYAVTFFKKIPKNAKTLDNLSLVLFRILEENNERNFDGLRIIQEQGEMISKFLVKPASAREKIGTDIYNLKRALIRYLDTLWASLDVVQYLRYGDAEMISDDPNILQKYGFLGRDLTRQISISEQMSTVLASGLEVLQTIYNNQLQLLNNRLALLVTWLTVAGTAVLVPNTLATIFGIPSISNIFTVSQVIWILIVTTILSVVIAYLVVRRSKIASHNF